MVHLGRWFGTGTDGLVLKSVIRLLGSEFWIEVCLRDRDRLLWSDEGYEYGVVREKGTKIKELLEGNLFVYARWEAGQ